MKLRALVILSIALALAAVLFWPRTAHRASGVMPNEVYVWQRAWTGALKESIADHADRFTQLVALTAEVTWRNKQPFVTRVTLDYSALHQTKRPVGLALRIGPYAGPFDPKDERTRRLAELAASLLAEAETNQLRVAELQLDFDCAESKLDGYRVWVQAIRERVAPVPVVITALPAWLKRAACRRLIAAADGFVLQVHSLARPRDATTPFGLCDPEEARRAVERAGRLKRPFRVALPTYGYLVAFDANGRFAGLSAEGPERTWPKGTQVREVRADPETLARLVADWQRDRPHTMTGVIWYRLPVAGDTLNWSWPTLAAVMDGKLPRPNVRIEVRRPQPELMEIDLLNTGEADHDRPILAELRWRDAKLVATDGWHGFEASESGANAVQFHRVSGPPRLEAGQRRTIGWVRLNREAEVEVKLESSEGQ